MSNKFLIKARIIEVRDVMSMLSYISILIFLPPKRMIILQPACIRKVKNKKRRTLEGIMRAARKGCEVTEQTNIEILNNDNDYLYIVYLTKEDLGKMIKDKKLLNEIYVNYRESNGSNDGE